MRTSTGKPTKAQANRFMEMKLAGFCITCNVGCVPEIHHLIYGNKRRGHDYTVALCPWCHRGVRLPGHSIADMTKLRGPSLAHGSKAFHAEYGSDDELLALQNEILGQ